MDEDLEGGRGGSQVLGRREVAIDLGDLLQGELAAEDDSRHVEGLGGVAGAPRARDGGLRGGVDLEARGDAPTDFHDADVLDDDSVHAGLVDSRDGGLHRLDLLRENQDVQAREALDAVLVEKAHDLGKLPVVEVVRSGASVEALLPPGVRHAKVDGVRAVRDGRPKLRPPPDRRENLGLLHPGGERARGSSGAGAGVRPRTRSARARRYPSGPRGVGSAGGASRGGAAGAGSVRERVGDSRSRSDARRG